MSGIDATDAVERELKLAVTDDEILNGLAGLADLGDGTSLGHPAIKRVQDAYLDTPDFALLRAGWTLRVRGVGEARTMTAKALARATGAIHARREIEGPLLAGADPADPAAWPDAIRSLADELLGAAGRTGLPAFGPIARLDQVRHVRNASAADRPLAELSLDRVAVRHPRPADAPDDAPVTTLRTVELEALPGADAAAFERMAEALEAAVAGSPEPGGKLERALYALAEHLPGDPEDAQGVRPEMPMAEAGRLIWRRQLMAMLLSEAGARDGTDIEYVHDMRVATRRARSMDRLFGDFWDRDAVAPLLDGLKRTARTLGEVRDLDVALDDLTAHRAEMAPADAAALAPLAEYWTAMRYLARRRLFAWLDSRRYRRFVRAMDRFTRSPGDGTRPPAKGPAVEPTEVRHVLPARILTAFSVVRAYEGVIGRPETPVETLHALRIDAKRLRYALEPVPHLLGADGEATVKMLKRLQDHVGRMNDAAVAGDRLRAAEAEGLRSPALSAYIAEQDARLEERVATLGEAWEPFAAPSVRKRLLAALARM